MLNTLLFVIVKIRGSCFCSYAIFFLLSDSWHVKMSHDANVYLTCKSTSIRLQPKKIRRSSPSMIPCEPQNCYWQNHMFVSLAYNVCEMRNKCLNHSNEMIVNFIEYVFSKSQQNCSPWTLDNNNRWMRLRNHPKISSSETSIYISIRGLHLICSELQMFY